MIRLTSSTGNAPHRRLVPHETLIEQRLREAFERAKARKPERLGG